MRIVIDANRIIAAMIKESTTRDILFDKNFEFLAPDYTITEVHNHEEELRAKTKLSHEEFEVLLSLIFERIKIVPQIEYSEFIEIYKDDIEDKDDLPYIAVCIASKSDGIWTHDPHLLEQNIVKTFTNIDMLKLSGQIKKD